MVAQKAMMKNIKYCFKTSVFKFVCFKVREKWKILTSLEGIWKSGKMLNWSNTCQEVLPNMEEGPISHPSGFEFPSPLIFLVMNIWKCSKWWLHCHSEKCIKNVCITVLHFSPFFPLFPPWAGWSCTEKCQTWGSWHVVGMGRYVAGTWQSHGLGQVIKLLTVVGFPPHTACTGTET